MTGRTRRTHRRPGEWRPAPSRGRPRPGQRRDGVGFVPYRTVDGREISNGNVLDSNSAALGHATNNEAEYQALILAMQRCLELGIGSAYFFTDSELMANQINGVYRIKNARLAQLAHSVKALRPRFDDFQLTYLSREKNKRADRLANEAVEASKKEGSDQARSSVR